MVKKVFEKHFKKKLKKRGQERQRAERLASSVAETARPASSLPLPRARRARRRGRPPCYAAWWPCATAASTSTAGPGCKGFQRVCLVLLSQMRPLSPPLSSSRHRAKLASATVAIGAAELCLGRSSPSSVPLLDSFLLELRLDLFVPERVTLAPFAHGEGLSTLVLFSGMNAVATRVASTPPCSSSPLSARVAFASASPSSCSPPFALYRDKVAGSPSGRAVVPPWPATSLLWGGSDQHNGCSVSPGGVASGELRLAGVPSPLRCD